MNLQSKCNRELLDRHISGFRQYLFAQTITFLFVSSNFCEMTGHAKEDLLRGDIYSLVHPADRANYERFLQRAANEKGSVSAEYRLFKKDGSVIFVKETISVEEDAEHRLIGNSVLTDISALKAENDNLRFLNDTVPCGMLRYTCEKQPRITYVNSRMLDFLRFPDEKDGDSEYLELCRENIYLMIPMEERRKFSLFLHRVDKSDEPIAGEISVLRCDGTKARLYGWVTKVKGESGTAEFQSVCMDVTERYEAKKAGETARYLKALSDVYDTIFEYDFSSGTVKYVAGGSETFEKLRDLPMRMKEATARWIGENVYPQDQPQVRTFFEEAALQNAGNGRPPQIRFRMMKSGAVYGYTAIFLRIAAGVSLLCCRKEQNEGETEALRSENLSLKNRNENMQEMIMRYTDGVAAFEVTNDHVTPLYASDNVCEFFGFTKEEWLPLMKRSTTIREFVSRSAVDYDKFRALLQNGEAEFTYYDIESGSERRIKAICSQKQADDTAPRYVMLYKMADQTPVPSAQKDAPRVYIRTFGYFEVFVGDKPIAFRNKKAKELLALLVDRRGGYVTGEQAIACLWEDEPSCAVTQSRYRKEALRLKNTLEEYGIGHILESVDGKRRVIPENFSCDLYEYLSGKEEYAGLFKGSYLSDYPWGETTLGELCAAHLK